MNKDNVLLIVGASGFVGGEIFNQAGNYYENVIGSYNENGGKKDLIHIDLSEFSPEKFSLELKKFNGTKHAILCSCVSQIDKCFTDPEKSYQINVQNSKKILSILVENGFKVAFISTDNVFSNNIKPYIEEDEKYPINLYGSHKDNVENYLIKNFEDYLIFRLSKVVASYRHPKNPFNEWEHLVKNNTNILCIKDQLFCPISVDDVGKIILESLNKGLRGVYHIVGAPILRRDLAGLFTSHFPHYSGKIIEKELDEFNFLDKRSLNIILDNSKIKKDLKREISGMTEVVEKYCLLIPSS